MGLPAMTFGTAPDFDPDEAAPVLEEAGWRLVGGVREKEGVRLEAVFVTATNAVLQKIQQLCKFTWGQIGIDVQLKQVDPSVFLEVSPGNEQSVGHFYADLQMYASSPGSPFPLDYMNAWYAGGGENVAQRVNGWTKLNVSRYANPEYDLLYEAAAAETDPEQAAALFVAMNDLLVEDCAALPLVQRAAEKYGISRTLRDENVAAGAWEAIYWNIANWNRAD